MKRGGEDICDHMKTKSTPNLRTPKGVPYNSTDVQDYLIKVYNVQ